MKTVFQNRLYNFFLDAEHKVLIFDWTEETKNMSDEDFLEALHNYAGFAFEYGGPGLLVDVRKFRHALGKAASAERNEVLLPRYLAAGSDKMAYVMPAQALPNLPKGDVQIGAFTDRYFGSREEATAWLNS